MRAASTGFTGHVPLHYDRGLVPVFFVAHAADTTGRVAASNSADVLQPAAGTGIVTLTLRDALPLHITIVSTDLNPDRLAIALAWAGETDRVTLLPVDGTALPYRDQSFDAVVCQLRTGPEDRFLP